MQKHIQRNKDERRHSSLEKYTPHIIWKGSKGLLKVLLCERWVGDWTELQRIDPHSYGHNRVSFPFSWAAQLGAWGPSLSGTCSHFSIFSPTNSNFLCTELYYCFTTTQFNLSTVRVIPLKPSTGCTCYLHRRISYFDSSAGVNMQHMDLYKSKTHNYEHKPLLENKLLHIE